MAGGRPRTGRKRPMERSKDIFAEIGIARDLAQLLLHKSPVDRPRLPLPGLRIEADCLPQPFLHRLRTEEHTSELPALMRTTYYAFFLTKNNTNNPHIQRHS